MNLKIKISSFQKLVLKSKLPVWKFLNLAAFDLEQFGLVFNKIKYAGLEVNIRDDKLKKYLLKKKKYFSLQNDVLNWCL